MVVVVDGCGRLEKPMNCRVKFREMSFAWLAGSNRGVLPMATEIITVPGCSANPPKEPTLMFTARKISGIISYMTYRGHIFGNY